MTFAAPATAFLPAAMPATARLRAELLFVADIKVLVSLFAAALLEHGIAGHLCMARGAAGAGPIAGDCPSLLDPTAGSVVVDTASGERVILAAPSTPLSRAALTRVRGYAELYGARLSTLREQADDVETGCGLSLRERYVLGRRLAGLAPVDIAIESGLSVVIIAEAIDSAVARLGAASLADAISVAARRGWLAVANVRNCFPSLGNCAYKMTKNG